MQRRKTPKKVSKNDKNINNNKRVSIQDQTKTDENVVCGQPQSCQPSIFERSTFPTARHITNGQSSFAPPSFNLQTHLKSTPIRNCDSTCFETAKNLSNENLPVHTTLKRTQNKRDNPIDESEMQCNQTFYSLC